MVVCSQVPAPGRGEGAAWAGIEHGLQAPIPDGVLVLGEVLVNP